MNKLYQRVNNAYIQLDSNRSRLGFGKKKIRSAFTQRTRGNVRMRVRINVQRLLHEGFNTATVRENKNESFSLYERST